MNMTLAPDLAQLVNQKLASGFYHSADEVIREALQLLQEQDEDLAGRWDELRREIDAGLAQLRNGEGMPGQQVFDEISQLSQQRRQAKP